MKLINTFITLALVKKSNQQNNEVEETTQTPGTTSSTEVLENSDDNEDDNDEFETQTVKTKLTVGEKPHNMCDLGLVDTTLYRCDETEDEFLRCTAPCPNGEGIIKSNCECYKYWGPLVLYDPSNCIWNSFNEECFDEDPIPEGGYPDPEEEEEECEECALAASKKEKEEIEESEEPEESEEIEEKSEVEEEPEEEPEEEEKEPEEIEEEEEEVVLTSNPKFMRPVKAVTQRNRDEGDSWFSAEDLDDKAHFSGFLRHLDNWAKLTVVSVDQGEMQPVMYQQL